MKVKLTVSRCGPGFSQNRGDVVSVDDFEGVRLVDAGQAEAVDDGEYIKASDLYRAHLVDMAKAHVPEVTVDDAETEKTAPALVETADAKAKPEKAIK